ncbi:MAG: DUF423 domain-containing protein [Planctomycetales bacterium]|nr:DUF423 domain-containing protein [Planctomycetales bacterium]
MNAKTWFVLGASLGVFGVAAGTFGAHALPDYLKAAGAESDLLRRQNWWETGVRYQMYHALALFAVAWIAEKRKSFLPGFAGLSMFVGTLIFSGCLFALALTGQKFIGAIVPIGGVLFIVGWVLLAVAGLGLAAEPLDKNLTGRDNLLLANKSTSDVPTSEDTTQELPASSES